MEEKLNKITNNRYQMLLKEPANASRYNSPSNAFKQNSPTKEVLRNFTMQLKNKFTEDKVQLLLQSFNLTNQTVYSENKLKSIHTDNGFTLTLK